MPPTSGCRRCAQAPTRCSGFSSAVAADAGVWPAAPAVRRFPNCSDRTRSPEPSHTSAMSRGASRRPPPRSGRPTSSPADGDAAQAAAGRGRGRPRSHRRAACRVATRPRARRKLRPIRTPCERPPWPIVTKGSPVRLRQRAQETPASGEFLRQRPSASTASRSLARRLRRRSFACNDGLGGAGVREPRRPSPTSRGAAVVCRSTPV